MSATTTNNRTRSAYKTFYSVDHPEYVVEDMNGGSGSFTGSFHTMVQDMISQLRAKAASGEFAPSDLEDVEELSMAVRSLRMQMLSHLGALQRTWKQFKAKQQFQELGTSLRRDLVKSNAQLERVFYGTSLEGQMSGMMAMMDKVVNSFDDPVSLMQLLSQTGAEHRRMGIKLEDFLAFRDVFFALVPQYIGEKEFAESEGEWKEAWKLILETIRFGYHSEDGELAAAAFDEARITTVQSCMNAIAIAEADKKGSDSFIGFMYAYAIKCHPHLCKYDALISLRAGRSVFNSMLHISRNLRDNQKVAEYVRQLGARHTAYGVTEEDMLLFQAPFLRACRHFLGKEKFTVPVKWDLGNFFSQITSGILSGMRGADEGANVYAPSGSDPFCLVFTDIENSTKLWQENRSSMSAAVKQHHRLIRILIAEYGAYEVKTVGDSFIIACKDMLIGVKLALAIQLDLMRAAPIAEGFRMTEGCEGGGDPECWDERTLRVRVGIEYCTEATPTYDPIHRRYDYYGTSVNRCARIEAAACGGQILMSRQTLEALMAVPEFHNEPCSASFRYLDPKMEQVDARGLDRFVALGNMGLASLKGISEPVHLVSMVPSCLAGRVFRRKFQRVGRL